MWVGIVGVVGVVVFEAADEAMQVRQIICRDSRHRRSQQFSEHENDHRPRDPSPTGTTRVATVEPSRKVSQNQFSPAVDILGRFRDSMAHNGTGCDDDATLCAGSSNGAES
jgi:hypothetical protein